MMFLALFRKKPVEIEAVPCDEVLHNAQHDWAALPSWIIDAYEGKNPTCKTLVFTPEGTHISTREGVMLASPGDWIIRGTRGELNPCKPGIFADTFEPILE